jgi:hypothetical protein
LFAELAELGQILRIWAAEMPIARRVPVRGNPAAFCMHVGKAQINWQPSDDDIRDNLGIHRFPPNEKYSPVNE